MEPIKKNILHAQTLQKAEEYSNQLASVARMTNWHERKGKFDKPNELKAQKKKCA